MLINRFCKMFVLLGIAATYFEAPDLSGYLDEFDIEGQILTRQRMVGVNLHT